MASQRNERGAVLIVLAMIWAGVTAQESDDCTNVLVSMVPCMTYITWNSSPQFSGCCTQLSTVVDKKPECFCQVLNGGDSNMGLNINQTQASALTTACKVQTPPASRCNGHGSNSVPPSQGGSNDATSTNMAAPLSLCFLFIASYASIINMA
uniref:Non-specific lipid-transfer protein-like protein At2g13820 n=2 Tax=Nicotiana TaxID=4085 RepID=A0A1S4CPM5_TOBAC|nr:PREDICTED: non-specific lipid-transfer protein-like protein At2g13820 [Nicotiana sylvestris]XP_016503015.1 PREDICTED: non-specific lipid-transfer protein-like protein At2g13820 [Nicotiana tabacum]